jgi:hypothetical protein
VKLGHLKSLYDTSYLLCDSLDMTLSDDFDSCHIYDLRTARFLDPLAIETQTPEPQLPILFVRALSDQISLKVMTRFEILRRSIEERVNAKKLAGGAADERPSRKTQRY